MAALATVLALSLISPSNGQTKASAEDAKRFVQAFYDWYLPFFTQKDGDSEKAIRKRPELFDKAFLQAFMEDRKAQSKCAEDVGLDYDPFLQAQDSDGKYVVSAARSFADGFRVAVNATGERAPWIYADVVFHDGRWRFTDFSDHDGHDVLKVLAHLKEDRFKNPCVPAQSSGRLGPSAPA